MLAHALTRGSPVTLARAIAVSRRDVWPLLLPAVAVLIIAAVGTSRVPGPLAAALLAGACAASSPLVAAALVIVAANDPHLFRGAALGPVTPVDVAIAATFLRAALSADRRRPSALEWCAIGFLLAGGAGTAVAHGGSASTSFLRVASYLVVGLGVGRALGAGDRLNLVRAFVGAEAAQAAAALTTLTSTTFTDFPFGRYLGTLGDPAQFGIPIAFACVLLAFSPHIVSSRYARYALVGLCGAAVVGSVTRSAWAVLGAGFLLAATERAGKGRSTPTRLMFGAGVVATASAATALVLFGAGPLGLNRESAHIRGRSIHDAWSYLVAHPLYPLGLGNHGPVTRLAMAKVGTLAYASSFETGMSGWGPFHDSMVVRKTTDSVFGANSLKVTTAGRQNEEGVQLRIIGGIIPDFSYTYSLYARVPKGVVVWLYIDEYDASAKWITYGYTTARGRGGWWRYSRAWRTTTKTKYLRLYVVTPSTNRLTSFLIDGVQLNAGKTATLFAKEKENLPPIAATYNTWLAVAIELGLIAAVLLAALAVGAAYHAHLLGDSAAASALVALLVPSVTEDFVYGASFVTLIWLTAIGLAVTIRLPAPPTAGHESRVDSIEEQP